MENKNKNPSEPCQICADIGVEEFLMTCFNCRVAREHIYCAKICLRSVPDMWLCEACRSSTRVLHISKLVDKDVKVLNQKISNGGSKLHPPPSNGLMLLAHTCLDEGASLVFNDTSSSTCKGASLVNDDTSSSKKMRPQYLAFPSPKRKRRTVSLSRIYRRY